MIRALTKFVEFEEIWLKALGFVWMCVFERVTAVCKWMPKLRGCLGLKIRAKTICGVGGPGGTKKWVPPVWSEGAVGSEGKIKQGLSWFLWFYPNVQN